MIFEIEKIIERFDFEEVHEVMLFLDWKWYVPGTKNTQRIPTVEQLEVAARKLLGNFTLDKKLASSSGGGFVVKKGNEEGESYLELSFVIEYQSGFYKNPKK